MNEVVKGIVLSRTDYKENDVILNVLTTNNELLSIYARGIRKSKSKNSYACNLLTISDFTYQAKNKKIPLLITGNTLKTYQDIYDDYDLIIVATLMANIVAEILNYDENWLNAYEFINSYLEKLNKKNNLVLIFSVFLVEILHQLGININVDGCAFCNHLSVVGIDINLGGFVCSKHAENSNIYDKEFLRQFRIINKATLKNYHQLIMVEPFDKTIIRILVDFLERYSGLKFTTFKFIQSVFSI